MKLRRNQQCPIHRSLYCCGREVVPKKSSVRQLGVQRIEDLHHPRGYRELRSNAEMRKLLTRKSSNRTERAPSAWTSSPTTTISCPITSIPEAWEAPGVTIIPTISKRFIGGAMERRDQAECREHDLASEVLSLFGRFNALDHVFDCNRPVPPDKSSMVQTQTSFLRIRQLNHSSR